MVISELSLELGDRRPGDRFTATKGSDDLVFIAGDRAHAVAGDGPHHTVAFRCESQADRNNPADANQASAAGARDDASIYAGPTNSSTGSARHKREYAIPASARAAASDADDWRQRVAVKFFPVVSKISGRSCELRRPGVRRENLKVRERRVEIARELNRLFDHFLGLLQEADYIKGGRRDAEVPTA
jgi:hypothetical protein